MPLSHKIQFIMEYTTLLDIDSCQMYAPDQENEIKDVVGTYFVWIDAISLNDLHTGA